MTVKQAVRASTDIDDAPPHATGGACLANNTRSPGITPLPQ